jgi:hypothetical protein
MISMCIKLQPELLVANLEFRSDICIPLHSGQNSLGLDEVG